MHEPGISASDLAEVDSALLYESTVRRLKSAAEPKSDTDKLQALSEHLTALAKLDLDKSVGTTIGRPSPCYALLRADGDDMGKLLSAAGTRTQASSALNQFALNLRGGSGGREATWGVIAGNNGVTLYAGADEMLAVFLPVENAIEAVRAIPAAHFWRFSTRAWHLRQRSARQSRSRIAKFRCAGSLPAIGNCLSWRKAPEARTRWPSKSGMSVAVSVTG